MQPRAIIRTAAFLIAAVAIAGSMSCGDGTGPSDSASTKIAFMSRSAQGIWDIWLINADGSGLRNLTRSPEEEVYPAWNRARTQIAFRSDRSPGGVFVINANGSGLRNVYSEPTNTIDHLSWSPDGRSLAIEGGWPGTGRQIRRVDLGEGPSRVLINDGFSPDWSPDGTMIAFHGGAGNNVLVMDAATGGNIRNLTPGRAGLDPSWSPDGTRIAYVGGTGAMRIWVMNADGSNPVQVSTGTGTDRLPVWSSDGRQIAFQRNTDYEVTTIWVINADGTGQRNLNPSMPISSNPTW